MLEGIEAAAAAGLAPVKINMVVKRGVERPGHRAHGRALARQRPHRALHRVHGRRLHQRLAHGRRRALGRNRAAHLGALPLEPVDAELRRRSRRALALRRRRGRDRRHLVGDAGVLLDCTRTRLSTEGKLYTCLFAQSGHDLKSLLRARRERRGRSATRSRPSGSGAPTATRRSAPPRPRSERKVEMSYIGG